MSKSFADCYADVAALTAVPAGDSATVRRAHHGRATVHMTQGKGEGPVHTHYAHEAATGLFWQTIRLNHLP